MANTKPPEYDGVSTIEMAQVEITEGGFNRVKFVRSTSIPLHLPQFWLESFPHIFPKKILL